MIYVPQCLVCRRYRKPVKEDGVRRCEAFPEGIPEDLFKNRADHRNPFPGDNGIRFEAKIPSVSEVKP